MSPHQVLHILEATGWGVWIIILPSQWEMVVTEKCYWSYSFFISKCPRSSKFHIIIISIWDWQSVSVWVIAKTYILCWWDFITTKNTLKQVTDYPVRHNSIDSNHGMLALCIIHIKSIIICHKIIKHDCNKSQTRWSGNQRYMWRMVESRSTAVAGATCIVSCILRMKITVKSLI